jgi:hypothetical protein
MGANHIFYATKNKGGKKTTLAVQHTYEQDGHLHQQSLFAAFPFSVIGGTKKKIPLAPLNFLSAVLILHVFVISFRVSAVAFFHIYILHEDTDDGRRLAHKSKQG